MPAAKSKNVLSRMLEPLSEDELEQTAFDQTMDSGIENLDPVPRSRAKPSTRTKTAPKPAVSKVNKARTTARRTSGTSTAARSKPSNRRKALEERNAPNESETEEVEEFEEEAPVKKQSRRAEYGHDGYAKRAETKSSRSGKASARRAPSADPSSRYDHDAQTDSMDIEQSIEEVTEVPVQAPSRPVHRPQSRVRHESIQRQTSVPRSRAGSMSDPERRMHDSALRRKLGEMTKKFENLDVKYRQLKEIGMRDAETNFDRLRKSTEQRAKDQEDIIASLRKELAAVRLTNSDSRSLKTEVSELKAENQRLASDNSKLSSETKTATTSLLDAQNEARSLTAKLSTAREAQKAAEAAVAVAKINSAAGKGPLYKNGTNGANAALGMDVAMLKLKEELYSDLTGLMVRNVKSVEGEDVFDCIQTGRNGTLHFHLSIPPVPTNADGTANFDDAEFAYTPLLDEKNDRDLLDVLPDYLTEEICFPRSSAAKFYAKVLDCMTKKVVIEE